MIAIDPPLALPDMIAGLSFATLLGGQPGRTAPWLNVYEPGKFIGAHVDAGGDVQFMIPNEMPPPGEGGSLWVGTKERILLVAVGDVRIGSATAPQLFKPRVELASMGGSGCDTRLWNCGR